MVTNGDQWLLVNAKRNETTGFITWEADLLDARAALPALLYYPVQRASLLYARGPAARNLAG